MSFQTTFPVAALSAKAAVDVSPYTTPSATATPSGPGPVFSGMFTGYSHFSFPVASEIAYTLAYRSCMYTTPSTTTGAAASEPAPFTRSPRAAGQLERPRLLAAGATLAAVIVEPVASRVLARSPFGYGHDPDGRAAPANVLVAGAGWLELHAADARQLASRASGRRGDRTRPRVRSPTARWIQGSQPSRRPPHLKSDITMIDP